MTKAQQWLDRKYLQEEQRKNITELDINDKELEDSLFWCKD